MDKNGLVSKAREQTRFNNVSSCSYRTVCYKVKDIYTSREVYRLVYTKECVWFPVGYLETEKLNVVAIKLG